MGEDLLGNPLKVLNEEEVFDSGLLISEVIERSGIPKGASQKTKTDFYNRLFGMYDDGLISLINAYDKSRLEEYRRNENLYVNTNAIRIRISAKGFSLLNDIRMKKIMEDVTTALNTTNTSVSDLKDSIGKFNHSSSGLLDKIKKSSENVEALTIILLFATGIIIALQIPNFVSTINNQQLYGALNYIYALICLVIGISITFGFYDFAVKRWHKKEKLK